MLLSLLLEYLKLFCSLQGVPKIVQILTFFLHCLKYQNFIYGPLLSFRHWRKKVKIWTSFWTPCNEQNIFWYSKDTDDNTGGLLSSMHLFIWAQWPFIWKAKSDKLLSKYASSWHLTIYVCQIIRPCKKWWDYVTHHVVVSQIICLCFA